MSCLSPLRGWGSLTMTITGKFVSIYLSSYLSIHNPSLLKDFLA